MQDTTSCKEGKGKLQWWAILLIVLGSFAFLFLLGFICCTYIW